MLKLDTLADWMMSKMVWSC